MVSELTFQSGVLVSFPGEGLIGSRKMEKKNAIDMSSDLYDNTCALQVRMTVACPYPGYMGNLVCNRFLSVNCLNGCLTSSQVSSPTPG